MPFDLTALADYAKDNAEVFVTSAISGGTTADLIKSEGNIQTGIKTSDRIGVFDTDAVFQDGNGCGFNASGTTRISQREITVAAIKINESLCIDDLNKKYTQLKMKAGATSEELPAAIEKMYVDRKAEKIENQVETLLWQGDTDLTGDAVRKWINGWLKLLDAASGVVTVNAKKGTGTITATTGAATVAGVGTAFNAQVAVGDKIYAGGVLIGTVLSIGSDTALTLTANGAAAATGAAFTIAPVAVTSPILASTGIIPGNVLAIVKSVYMGIPAAVLESENPVYIFMGTDIARMHLMALSDADLYNYKVEGNELRDGYYLPGTTVKIKPTPGLSGTSRIVAAQTANMWIGTDLENDFEQFKMWFSDDDDLFKFKMKFRVGVQWSFPDEVVSWLGAA